MSLELAANHLAVFLNFFFFFWEQTDFSADGIDCGVRDGLLTKLRAV